MLRAYYNQVDSARGMHFASSPGQEAPQAVPDAEERDEGRDSGGPKRTRNLPKVVHNRHTGGRARPNDCRKEPGEKKGGLEKSKERPKVHKWGAALKFGKFRSISYEDWESGKVGSKSVIRRVFIWRSVNLATSVLHLMPFNLSRLPIISLLNSNLPEQVVKMLRSSSGKIQDPSQMSLDSNRCPPRKLGNTANKCRRKGQK